MYLPAKDLERLLKCVQETILCDAVYEVHPITSKKDLQLEVIRLTASFNWKND